MALFALPERTLLFNKKLVSCLCHPDLGKMKFDNQVCDIISQFTNTHESHIPELLCFALRALTLIIRASRPSCHRYRCRHLRCHQGPDSLFRCPQWQDLYCDGGYFQPWTTDALVYGWGYGGSGLGRAAALEELTAYVCQQIHNGSEKINA